MDRLSLAVEPAQLECVPSRFSSEQLAQARALATGSGERVLEALGGLCELAPMPFIQCLGATLHYPVLDTDTLFQATPVFDRVTLAQCLKREFILLRHDDAVIGVFADPFDTTRLAWIDDCLHGAPLYLVHADDLKAYLARHEESFHAVESLNAQADANVEIDTLQSLSLTSISEDASVVVKLVNSTLYDALKMHASDIHLGTTGSGLVIKYRIDGVLNNISKIQGSEFAEQVISRVKVMAELDIGEKRVPQDGRFKIGISGRQIDFRVSIMPSIFGEDAVLRVLDKQDLADKVSGVQLQALGFEE
ncbi:MAG: general secretion pathway protein GspE, partial [Pseudomonas sp.]|nr:general secretion pathway protein GspE [Pseudomonas sp.]